MFPIGRPENRRVREGARATLRTTPATSAGESVSGTAAQASSEAPSWPYAVNGSLRGTWTVSDAYGRIGYRARRLRGRYPRDLQSKSPLSTGALRHELEMESLPLFFQLFNRKFFENLVF